MRLNQRIRALERHAYAPELNRLHIGGVTLSVPDCRTIGAARDKLGWRPVKAQIVARVSSTYDEPYAWLNRTRQGSVLHREDALRFMRQERERLAPRPLLNGEMGPTPTIKVKTWLWG